MTIETTTTINPATTTDCTNQFSLEDCGFDKLAQFHQSTKAICLDLYPEEYKMYSPLCMTATLQGILADIMKSEVIEYFEDLTTISDYVNGIPSDPLTLEAEEKFEGEEGEPFESDLWDEDEEEEDPDPWEEEEEKDCYEEEDPTCCSDCWGEEADWEEFEKDP